MYFCIGKKCGYTHFLPIEIKYWRYENRKEKTLGASQYYFTDIGLRNARLNFRQQEEGHIMENIIYNELTARDFNVDVGMVEINHTNIEGKNVRSQLEVDFVVNKASRRYYIQSALTVADEDKRQQEVRSLNHIDDSYTKIVVVRDNILPWVDDKGIEYINVEDFLLKRINEI